MSTESLQKKPSITKKTIIIARNRLVALLYLIVYACLLASFIGVLEPAAITFFQHEPILCTFLLFLINIVAFYLILILWYGTFRHLIARGPLLTIGDTGIEIGRFITLPHSVFLPWSEITHIYALSLPSQKCLVIRTRGLPQNHYLRVFNANRVILKTSVKIPNSYMNRPASTIVQQINRYYTYSLQANNIQMNQPTSSEVNSKNV